jgi:hypothetical protein
MQRLLLPFFLMFCFPASEAQLKVSPDHHFLLKNGKPFFWLGDTAWELFHRLTSEEAIKYLDNRAQKGFTVIQAVALAELDGYSPNANGDKPLRDNDPLKPNEAYFRHVDFMVREANKRGLIIAMLPTWGDKWNNAWGGPGPEIFTPDNAEKYGRWIAARYKNNSVVWVLGGDRNVENERHYAILRAMAKGIKEGDPNHLLTFHPTGGKSSYDYFAEDDWIDFHMSQTGHKAGNPDYKQNLKAYALQKVKPHVNGEPNYEDHPNDFKPIEKGWMDDVDTRQAAYWNMLSGGAGHTYGNHNIWQMYTEKRKPINNARTNWQVAMDYPGAWQMGWMRRMFEKRPWQKLRYNSSAIIGENPEGLQYKVAAVADDAGFMMVYIPYGSETKINTSLLKATTLKAWWFNPRDGKSIALGEFANDGAKTFTPGAVGRGSDWILVIDDAAKNYPDPQVN